MELEDPNDKSSVPTVSQAMESFISDLQPSDREEKEARRQRDVLRGHMQAAFAVQEFRISGSFKRKTAIHPLNDIDLFFVLNPDTERALRESAPKTVLAKVRKVLDEAYPTKDKPKAQSRSVNVEFLGTGLAFDIVPAFPHPQGGYIIPDRDANQWVRTNPPVHAEHSAEANERAGNKAKPIIKAIKAWNAQQEPKVARSFHLELMVYDQLTTAPTSYAAGLATAFRRLADRVMYPMPEPAGVGPDVDAGMSSEERRRARELLLKAAGLADQALAAGEAGRTGEAHYFWRAVFGAAYPEKGTAPKVLAPALQIEPSGAPDPQNRRFG